MSIFNYIISNNIYRLLWIIILVLEQKALSWKLKIIRNIWKDKYTLGMIISWNSRFKNILLFFVNYGMIKLKEKIQGEKFYI